jgi:predicted  nucleic acid-binding Zn-ribbon protein
MTTKIKKDIANLKISLNNIETYKNELEEKKNKLDRTENMKEYYNLQSDISTLKRAGDKVEDGIALLQDLLTILDKVEEKSKLIK